MQFLVTYCLTVFNPVTYLIKFLLVILREDQGDIVTKSLFFCIPEKVCRTTVPTQNYTVSVFLYHCIRSALNNKGEQFLKVFRFLLLSNFLIDDKLFLVSEGNRVKYNFFVNPVFTPYNKVLRSF